MPNYAILVDIRDRPSSQITYVPEENIELLTNTKVIFHILNVFYGLLQLRVLDKLIMKMAKSSN